jgi:hypothetical protein
VPEAVPSAAGLGAGNREGRTMSLARAPTRRRTDLEDGKRLLGKRPGLAIAALLPIEQGEVGCRLLRVGRSSLVMPEIARSPRWGNRRWSTSRKSVSIRSSSSRRCIACRRDDA